jgi:hypothetical protein
LQDAEDDAGCRILVEALAHCPMELGDVDSEDVSQTYPSALVTSH